MDISIVKKAIDGDTDAFEKLYYHTHDKGYSVAYGVLKDAYESEDVLQEAYVSMYRRLNTLENLNVFEGWFYRIVKNEALDYLKKKRPQTFSSFESEENEDFVFEETLVSDYKEFSPEENADLEETKKIINEIISKLPDIQRKCIILRYQEEMKISEIATTLGIPESTVKSNLTYAKSKIEKEVKEQEKNGVRLYSFTPALLMPFLRFMWGKGVPQNTISQAVRCSYSAVSATAAQSGTSSGANLSPAENIVKQTTSSAVRKGAAYVGKTASRVVLKRIIATVIAASVITGGVYVAPKAYDYAVEMGIIKENKPWYWKYVKVQKDGKSNVGYPHKVRIPGFKVDNSETKEANFVLKAHYATFVTLLTAAENVVFAEYDFTVDYVDNVLKIKSIGVIIQDDGEETRTEISETWCYDFNDEEFYKE